MAESESAKWLKSRYMTGPPTKRVKFSKIHDELAAHFTGTKFNSLAVSQAIKEAFPNTESKPCGKANHRFVFGLQEQESSTHESSNIEMLEHERMRSRDLEARLMETEKRVHELEMRLQELETTAYTPATLDAQMNRAMNPHFQIYHGPDSIAHLEDFSVERMIAEVNQQAPDVLRLLTMLGRAPSLTDTPGVNDMKTVNALCSLTKGRSEKVLGIQLLVGLMLIARSTHRQALSVLNHAGISVSYSTAWRYLNKLITDAKFTDMIHSGRLLWAYDNLNVHKSVRHEREDKHSSMLNVTSRLAVRLQNLPDWNVDWADSQPQCSRHSLTISDFLPSLEDARHLKERATAFLMRFLAEEFNSLSDLESFAPKNQSPHPVQKSDVIPMKVLFKDEKYISETVDILSQLMVDANMTGDPQIVVGDQLTCKCIRGAKVWRQAEQEPKDTLSWAKEIPGDFHFLWECLKVIFQIFWGSPSQQGSLCNLREIIQRVQVDKAAKVFNVADEFMVHVFKAHLSASICTLLKLQSTSEVIHHEATERWLRETAETLLADTIMPVQASDPVYALYRSFLHLEFLYYDLRNAIRWEDGTQIIQHWVLWLPRFLATVKKNYASEAVNLIANLKADFPKHIAYLAIHNRTVNTEGKAGRGKLIDQMVEHYNLIFKEAIRGGNQTVKHLEVSLGALFLLDAAKKANKAFCVTPPGGKHTVREACRDIKTMTNHLLEKGVANNLENQSSPKFTNPEDAGLDKLTSTWLHEASFRTCIDDTDPLSESTDEENEQSVDIHYETADIF